MPGASEASRDGAGDASSGAVGDELPFDRGIFSSFELLGMLSDPEEQQKLRDMMRLFQGPEETEEQDGRGLYHDAGCLLRYLRARKWDLQAAENMLRNTGRWRRSFGFAGVVAGEHAESLAMENDSGKLYVRGIDRRGRPAVYMKPRNENSSDKPAMVRHLVYCVERAVRCVERQAREGRLPLPATDPNAGKFVVIVDFADYSLNNLIPLSVARAVINILQDHYPERLGQAFVFHAPWILNAFIAAVSPFIDPVTMEKVQFIHEEGEERSARMEKVFDLSVLEPDFGGTATAPFESHIFLSCKRGGTEFGLEFNEQLSISEEETAEAKLKALQESSYEDMNGAFAAGRVCANPNLKANAFWGVSSDPRVMRLGRRERGLVREFARVLALETDDTFEDYDGLFDDAGSLIRYLRSQAWNLLLAEEKIRATARWRKDFGLATQRCGTFSEVLAREASLGRMYVRGFDRQGQPIIYIKLNRRDSRRPEDTLRYFVYCLERAIACIEQRFGPPSLPLRRFSHPSDATVGECRDPVETFALLVDFAGYSGRHRPRLRTVRRALSVLQEHYPERLGAAYLLRPPLKVRMAWRLARRTVDPAVYQKVFVVRGAERKAELMRTAFDKTALETCMGGGASAPFEPHIFLNQQVDGEVYGSEYEAQASAASSDGARAAARRVTWADSMDLPLKEVNEDGSARSPFSLSCLFGGSSASLW